LVKAAVAAGLDPAGEKRDKPSMSGHSRRRFMRASGAAVSVAAFGNRAGAQDGALEAVRIVTGFPAGGTSDVLCRLVAEGIAGSDYAKAAHVENRGGDGGQRAVQAMLGAPADGSVLLETPAAVLILYPHVRKKLGYADFAAVTAVTMACVLEFAIAVGPAVPIGIKTLTDFFTWCKANPDKASFGSPGAGSVPQLIGTLVGKTAGVELKHTDFNSTRAMLRGVTDGIVSAGSGPIGDFLGEMRDGRLRLLGVSGRTRSRFVPDVPTYLEQGLTDMAFSEWYGFFLPGDASASVVLKANQALRTALKRPDVIEHLAQVALEARSSTPVELATRLTADKERWGPLLRRIDIDVDN
jgi:tripartite-type tricarboxylate transporter receptor subunit TctC